MSDDIKDQGQGQGQGQIQSQVEPQTPSEYTCVFVVPGDWQENGS